MGLQSLIRVLLPREDHFYVFLERQAETALGAARALATFKDGKSVTDVRDAVQTIEHAGDKIVHEMEEALARTFVTPIDREDLQNLSAELDDIIDLTNYAARACALYGIDKPSPAMTKLTEVLVRATEALSAALPCLRKHEYPAIIEAARKIRTFEKEADGVYREAVRVLFADAAIDAKALLREKEVLHDVEIAVNHCEHVADRLTYLAVKHG